MSSLGQQAVENYPTSIRPSSVSPAAAAAAAAALGDVRSLFLHHVYAITRDRHIAQGGDQSRFWKHGGTH